MSEYDPRQNHISPEPQSWAGVVSHEGMTRPHNEDSVIVVSLTTVSGEPKLYVVADGAGGMSSGKLASRITVETVEQAVANSVTKNTPQETDGSPYSAWLEAAVYAANDKVHLQAKRNQAKMASTLVMALVREQNVYIANVGDSRAYLVDEFGLRQITQDHSAAQELLNAGLITEDEVKGHPFEHVLTRAIGPETHVKPDIFTERLNPGDRLLLCSDGLTNMVNDDEIWEIVWRTPGLQEAAQALVDRANRAGGKDNITAVVVQIKD